MKPATYVIYTDVCQNCGATWHAMKSNHQNHFFECGVCKGVISERKETEPEFQRRSK